METSGSQGNLEENWLYSTILTWFVHDFIYKISKKSNLLTSGPPIVPNFNNFTIWDFRWPLLPFLDKYPKYALFFIDGFPYGCLLNKSWALMLLWSNFSELVWIQRFVPILDFWTPSSPSKSNKTPHGYIHINACASILQLT